MLKRIKAWATTRKERRNAMKQDEWVTLHHDNEVAVVVAEKIRRGDPLKVKEINYGFQYDAIQILKIPCADDTDSWTEFCLKINDDHINASEHILNDIYMLCKGIFEANTQTRIKTALDAIQ